MAHPGMGGSLYHDPVRPCPERWDARSAQKERTMMLDSAKTIENRPVTQTNDQQKFVPANVNFHYGDHNSLKNVSLSFPERRVSALIGPSGCGKSTLLRILNRIYMIYPKQRATGTVTLDGENILDDRYPM